MTSDDLSSSDSIPKRTGSRFLSIVLPLILINATLANLLTTQVFAVTSTDRLALVKDDITVATAVGGADTESISEDAIVPDEAQPVITTYVVKSGDTLSGIADKFGISVNTIRWANDLTSKTSKITIGDELVILPVTGIEYTVKKGDTLSGIAAKFDVSKSDILEYNDVEESALKIGTELIIPEAEPLPVAPTKKVAQVPPPIKKVAATSTAKAVVTSEVKDKEADTKTETKSETKNVRFTNPVPGAVLTQRIHDGNAVDFGLPVGSPVLAAAAGKVIIAKTGYNGGYGTYVVMTHADGSQTLYAHLSKLNVVAGDTVSQGERIGSSGNTGRSTGPHLHYKEISTGAKNTFATLPLH